VSGVKYLRKMALYGHSEVEAQGVVSTAAAVMARQQPAPNDPDNWVLPPIRRKKDHSPIDPWPSGIMAVSVQQGQIHRISNVGVQKKGEKTCADCLHIGERSY